MCARLPPSLRSTLHVGVACRLVLVLLVAVVAVVEILVHEGVTWQVGIEGRRISDFGGGDHSSRPLTNSGYPKAPRNGKPGLFGVVATK